MRMRSKNWSKKFDKCQQCGTERYRHVAKGFCTRCYPLIRKLDEVNGWSVDNPGDLKEWLHEKSLRNPVRFQRAKSNVVQQIRARLEYLKIREESLKGPIDGIDIEFQLTWIASRCRGVKNKDLFYNEAGTFDEYFGPKQRKILFELLNEIEENIAWTGINWLKV